MRRRLLRFCSVILMVVMVFSACPTYAAYEQPSSSGYAGYYSTIPSHSSGDYWTMTAWTQSYISYQLKLIRDNLPTIIDYSSILNSILTKLTSIDTALSRINTNLISIMSNTDYLPNISNNTNALVNTNYGLAAIKSDISSLSNSSYGLLPLYSQQTEILNKIPNLSFSVLSRLNYPGRSSVTGDLSVVSVVSPYSPRLGFSGGTVTIAPSGYSADNIGGLLYNYLSSFLYATSLVSTYNTQYFVDTYLNNTKTSYRSFSIHDTLNLGFNNLLSNLGRLSFILADDDTIAAKQANKDQEQSVLSNFTGSGGAAASVSDFVGVKDGLSDFKSSLSGGAAASDVFDVFDSSSDGWSWFSSDTSNNLDNVQSGTSARRVKSRTSSTPLIDAYYADVMSHLGGNL